MLGTPASSTIPPDAGLPDAGLQGCGLCERAEIPGISP